MFEHDGLEELLDLHRRSYGLLRWIDEQVQRGTLRLGALHGALDAAHAAAEWLSRNAASLPPAVRPPEGQGERFAHLFASYLTTSFELSDRKRVRGACACGFCSYLVNVPNLRARAPTRQDQEVARQLKLDCLEALAAEAGAALFRSELDAFILEHQALQRPLTLVTYVRELERRAAFAGQGRPVLALWRELAWQAGRLDRGFQLEAEAVLAAERALLADLRDLANGSAR